MITIAATTTTTTTAIVTAFKFSCPQRSGPGDTKIYGWAPIRVDVCGLGVSVYVVMISAAGFVKSWLRDAVIVLQWAPRFQHVLPEEKQTTNKLKRYSLTISPLLAGWAEWWRTALRRKGGLGDCKFDCSIDQGRLVQCLCMLTVQVNWSLLEVSVQV